MGLVNRSIPNLYNGVSQQPPSLRLTSQASEQINGLSSVVFGLSKRPNTRHIAKLSTDTHEDSFVHTINRDATEKYKVVITNGSLKVYDINGVEKIVSFPDGSTYLNATDPLTSFACVTVADYTFIVNKTVTAQQDLVSVSGTAVAPQAITSITHAAPTLNSITRSGSTATGTTAAAHGLAVGDTITISGATDPLYSGTFRVASVPTGTTFTYVMTAVPAASPATGSLSMIVPTALLTAGAAHGLVVGDMVNVSGATQPEYNGLYTIATVPSTTTLKYVFTDTTTVPSTPALGGVSYRGYKGIKGSKQQFIDLPASGTIGDVYEVAGTGTNSFDNYYVKWDGSSTWRESVRPGVLTSLDALTMPHRLVNNGDGTFTFSKNEWAERLVGDDLSAAFPSFIGNKIADVFFHRNRLGFIANENVIFSRAGSFFNFFPETVTLVLDTDPVDVSVSHTKVAVLRHALAFNTSLMLFADQAQFQLTAKDILTPKTAVINVTTEFDIEANAKPTSSGTSIFFGVTKGNFSGIKEYLVQPLTYTNDASDVTAHVPKYIPKNLFKLASSNLENIVIALSKDERNAMYVYRYYWSSPEEKVQSSWSKFTLAEGDVILDADFLNTELFITVKRSDGTYLESLDLQDVTDGDLGVRILLDQKTEVTGVYDAINGWTSWTLPYPVDESFRIALGETFAGRRGTVKTPTSPSTYVLRVPGDYSSGLVYIGKPYTMRFTFSPVIFKDEQKVAVVHYRIKLKNFEVLYDTSGYFRAEVSPDGRGLYTYTYSGKTLGDTSMFLGDISLGTGKFRFPVMGDSTKSQITLLNDSVLPCTIQAAEWEGVLTAPSKHL
jgi:hypothetical protein